MLSRSQRAGLALGLVAASFAVLYVPHEVRLKRSAWPLQSGEAGYSFIWAPPDPKRACLEALRWVNNPALCSVHAQLDRALFTAGGIGLGTGALLLGLGLLRRKASSS